MQEYLVLKQHHPRVKLWGFLLNRPKRTAWFLHDDRPKVQCPSLHPLLLELAMDLNPTVIFV